MSNYEWRSCKICHQRIYKDEVEGDTIQTVDGGLYCIDCAEDILNDQAAPINISRKTEN